MTSDKGGEDAAGRCHPSSCSVGRSGRVPEAAGQRVREGDQTERARGQRREAGWYHPISLPKHPQFKNHFFLSFLLQPSKLSNDLVQQFLVPDQTPPILEAEMSLRAEQIDGSGGCALTPDGQNKQEASQEVRTQPARRSEERRTSRTAEPEEERMEEVKQTEERLQPEGRQAEAILPENDRRQVRLFDLEMLYGFKTRFSSNGFHFLS